MNNKRWIEIQFVNLIFNLNSNINNYITMTDYIELLAKTANIDNADALRVLQKVFNSRDLAPSTSEFICLAKKNKVTIESITKTLHISKKTYIKFYHEIDTSIDFPSRCNNQEIETMQALLNAHKLFKEAGL